jgi:multidrug efflux pump subunit AcrB
MRNQPFGFNAILGLIGLAGILMRNTLILIEQIKENRAAASTTITPSSRLPCNA